VTTPEQLLADATWRWRHSVYTLWALLFGLGFVSLLYTGVRAKKTNWTTWGIAYGVLVIGTYVIVGSVSPSDPDAPTPLRVDLAMMVLMVAWVVSAIHVFRARKEWLRCKASAAGQPRWYEAPVSTTKDPAADLSGIGMEDPAGEYLAGPPPDQAPTPTTSTRPPPPPLVAPSPHASRKLPPPPSPATPPANRGDATGPAPGAPEAPARNVVDLNTATVDELAVLPGIGIATATRIVEERKRRGGFDSVDEAAIAAGVQPHVRARLQKLAVVSKRDQPRQRGTSGRIVDI
jgi:hypothetical protein